MDKTKGQIEAALAVEMTRHQRDNFGRGPTACKVHLVDDLVIVHLKEVLIPSEQQLLTDHNCPENGVICAFLAYKNRELVKSIRNAIVEKARPALNEIIKNHTGCNVVSLHADLSTKTGNRMIVFVLDDVPECAKE